MTADVEKEIKMRTDQRLYRKILFQMLLPNENSSSKKLFAIGILTTYL